MFINGDREWFKDDFRHRDGDMPAVISTDGYQAWYKDGEFHRDIGPAKLDPITFYENGIARELESIRGETIVARALTSWSPVLSFI